MTIALHGKALHNHSHDFYAYLLKRLNEEKIKVYITDKLADVLQQATIDTSAFHVITRHHYPKQVDFFFSIGGDGTLLDSITYIGKHETPVLGINTGRLGFLATTAREDFDKTLVQLKEKAYTVNERIMLDLISTPRLFDDFPFALNDFTLVKKNTSSMIRVHVYVDGEKLNIYWADGIIVSTPTGSTGYSLSCGGPLISPQASCFVITAVSPHNLGTRPIIIPDSSVIKFEVEGRSKKLLATLDSRIETVSNETEITLRKAEFKARFVQIKGYHYFQMLRQKLNWGLDVRN